MKSFLVWCAVLALMAVPKLKADWTFTVTNSITAITAQENGAFTVIVRENATSPTATFTIWSGAGPVTAGRAGIAVAAGGAYYFSGTPFQRNQVIGYIQAGSSGPFTFAAITSGTIAPSPNIGVVADGKCLGNTGGVWAGLNCGGGGGGGSWSDLTAPTADLSLNMAAHPSTFANTGLFDMQIPALGDADSPSLPVLSLNNPTPGTDLQNGQYSPALEFHSHGWDGAASTSKLFRIFSDRGPSADLQFYGSNDGSTWNYIGEMYADGSGADWDGEWDMQYMDIQHDLTVHGACTGCTHPGGADTQMQFNDAGTLSGDSGFTYNKTTGTATLAGNLVLPVTADANSGVIVVNSASFIHRYGNENSFLGHSAGNFTLFGNHATGVGAFALNGLTTGNKNTAVGFDAAIVTADGEDNTAVGSSSLLTNTSGNRNSAIGQQALNTITTGSDNTGIGWRAGSSIDDGSFNTFLGSGADANNTSLTNAMAIGANATVAASNTIQLGNTSVTKINTSGAFQGLAIVGDGATPSVGTCGTIGTGSRNTAGFITSGTTGSCVSVITFSATAPVGWSCGISNSTTANLIRQTDSSTTTATFTGVTVSSDILRYICAAY